MKIALVISGLVSLAAIGAGCWSTPAESLGLGEPIRVHGATLVAGALPGSPPLTDAEFDAGVPEKPPHPTTINSLVTVLHPGQTGISLGGGVTDDADAVGVRFADIGDGYWVVPAGGADPTQTGVLTWSMSLDVSPDAPKGLHQLLFAGIDASGHGGTQSELDLCIDSPVPDNLNACDPTIPPPFAVLSLDWDTNADLDLELVAPDGTVLDPKHPSTAPETDGGVVTITPNDGVLDRDSNKDCVIDGVRREDVVWQAHPLNGQYLVYVNMFAACGQPAAHFKVTLYLSHQTGDHYALTPALTAAGELVAQDQNAGQELGLFVTEFKFD